MSAANVDRDRTTPLIPGLSFPPDTGLSELGRLFDSDWVWGQAQHQVLDGGKDPVAIRLRQLSLAPGKAAIVSYVAEFAEEDAREPQLFSIDLRRGRTANLSIYPNDRYLPGLGGIADSSSALDLVNKHVFRIPHRTIHVSVIRYRPSNRAVLKHRLGMVTFYVRAVRPRSVPGLLSAAEIGSRSGFVLPRIAGAWRKGGVLWISGIPGRNMRASVRSGNLPDIDELLNSLSSLWATPATGLRNNPRPFDLAAAYSRAWRSFDFALKDHDSGRQTLAESVRVLAPFVKSWRPKSIAHNDFYDDQLVVLPDGRLALVDFEDIGVGDPMLDVGNFLAHTLWASKFGNQASAESQLRLHAEMRSAALDKFGWADSDLALREAVCVFRICTNAIRRPRADWLQRVLSGLELVNEIAA